MTQRFQIMLLTSVAMLVASALIPFDGPYEVSFQIDEPPIALLLTSLATVLCVLTLPFSLYGLLRFRTWAPRLAVLAAIPLLILTAISLLPSDFAATMACSSKALLSAGTILWCIAVFMTRTAPLKDQFRVAL